MRLPFHLVDADGAAALYADPEAPDVVHIALQLLADDLLAVSGFRAARLESTTEAEGRLVIAGTLECPAIRQLCEQGKLPEAETMAGCWEQFFITIVDKRLIVAGSDRRGAAYGVLELSRQMGVSPWVWWADAPVPQHKEVLISAMEKPAASPAVKYRGIFINDEQFRLKPWAKHYLDTEVEDIGPRTYEKIFELMLRLRANYLWPAIAVTAFGFYPENDELADRFAIVLGGHHASSLLRSKHEWWRIHGKPATNFNYYTNPEGVRAFWTDRLKKTARLEALYTMGIRGLGDIPADIEGGLLALRDLNEQVLIDQRKLLAEHVNRDVTRIPQVLALWKEFEEFYGEGMQIPEDITLLRANDSYGWLQRLGPESEHLRAGGLGMYYHLSYLGRPYEYLQLCSTPPSQIWHQMRAALEFHCDRMWVVNVGDIKPAEYPLTYFMDLAWHGAGLDAIPPLEHRRRFFRSLYGVHGDRAAGLMQEYDRFAMIRRPEFMGWKRMEPSTPVHDSEFSLVYFDELNERLAAYKQLDQEAESLLHQLDPGCRDSYYQLVRFPIGLAASWNAKHLHAQKQRHFARLGCRPAAIREAEAAQSAYERMDGELYPQYQQLAGGKWRHFMDIHIVRDNYGPPVLERIQPSTVDAVLKVSGCPTSRTLSSSLTLPEFHPLTDRRYSLELHACREDELTWQAKTSAPWIQLDQDGGCLTLSERIHVSVAWDLVPYDTGGIGSIEINCGKENWQVEVRADAPARWKNAAPPVFVEENGRVSIPAAQYQRHRPKHDVEWFTLEGLGHHGRVITPIPFTAASRSPDWQHGDLFDSASVEYDVFLAAPGHVDVIVAALPTQPLSPSRGAAYAVSFDDSPPLRVDIRTHLQDEQWKRNVERNLSLTTSRHYLATPGRHVLKLWMADTNMAIDGLLIDCGGGWPAYQQPPHTFVGSP